MYASSGMIVIDGYAGDGCRSSRSCILLKPGLPGLGRHEGCHGMSSGRAYLSLDELQANQHDPKETSGRGVCVR